MKYILIKGLSKKLFLFLNQKDKKEIFSCPIAIGQNGLGKTKEGDKKTPLGEYKIKWMISGSDIKDKRTYCILDTQLYIGNLKNSGLSQEQLKIAQDEKLWTDAYGGYIMALDYPNEEDKQAGKTGTCIEIHASKNLERQGFKKYPGTHGCIAILPRDAKKLYKLISPGIPVRIVQS